jgi:hypothetical protein
MNEFEELVEAIAAAIKTQKRENILNDLLGDKVDPNDLEKLEYELRNAESLNALFGNDPAFKDWIRRTVKKYLNNELY